MFIYKIFLMFLNLLTTTKLPKISSRRQLENPLMKQLKIGAN